MPIDQKLLEILVCPQCKGTISPIDGENALACNHCKLKYPIRDGIPVMIVEEAVGLAASPRPPEGSAVRLPRVTFRVTEGPDINMTFQIEHGTCRAIGRADGDPNKTMVFNVDIALALDDETRGLILKYIGQQFAKARGFGTPGGEKLGQFRRTPDVMLTDTSLSKLHAMVFADEEGVGVLDLVSKNGTFVNGQEVESRMLSRGDIIELGETTITFEG